MAVSQMQKLSLILPKDDLDSLLLALQSEAKIQIYDLSEHEEWQAAFEANTLSQPLTEDNRQALVELQKRQEQVEKMIQTLEPYMPEKKALQALKEEPLSLSFDDLQAHGMIRDEDLLLTKLKRQLRVLDKARQKIADAKAEIERLEKWRPLEVTPAALATFHYVHGLIGTILNSDTDAVRSSLKAHPELELEEVFTSETEHGYVILYRSGDRVAVQELLEDHGFKELDYEEEQVPAAYLDRLEGEIKEQEAVAAATLAELQNSQKELDQLKYQLDYLLSLGAREEAKSLLASTQSLVALEGWIETSQVASLRDFLQEGFGSRVLLETRDVTEKDWDDVPIQLRNSALVEPFELVTEMYALPKYYEKDPTPIVSLFYFVFFGMMVADIGYGLLLTLATGFALKAFKLKPGTAKNLRFFSLLGISVALWGVVYGSFFGFEMPFALISTTSNAMTILILSVVFGFVTVLVGLFLGGMKNVRIKDYTEAYNAGFAWVLILLGLMLLAVGNILPGMSLLVPIGKWLAILNAIGILIVSIVSAKKLSGLASGLFNLYNVSGYVGDLVSFTRLMALGLSGASIGSAFNLIVNLFPPLGRFTVGLVLFIVLHAINMFLSFLSGYVHGARLIFVEFFGKFYEGGGKPFRPLKPSERYIKTKK